MNTSRKNWPNELKVNKICRKRDDPVRKLERGQCLYRQSANAKLVACVWKDTALVYNLNTCFNINVKVNSVERKQRRDGKWVKDSIPCPKPIRQFNQFMGGVDQHDHLRASYSTQRKSQKWWTYFAWYLVDVCLVNAYLLWKIDHKSDHKSFQLAVNIYT